MPRPFYAIGNFISYHKKRRSAEDAHSREK